jgi:hypothetical protein
VEELILAQLPPSFIQCAFKLSKPPQKAVSCFEAIVRSFDGLIPSRVTDLQVIADARRIVGEVHESKYLPIDPKEFCGRIFHTCYMGTENSSIETRKRAKDLADAIGR